MIKKLIIYRILFVFFIALFPFNLVISKDKMNKDIKLDLQKRLEVFSKDYDLSESDLYLILRDSLKDRAIPIGGLGTINKNIHAVLSSKSNELIIKDRRWIGSNRETAEIVIIDGNLNILSIPSKQDKIDLTKGFIFVYFKPEIIKFIDSSKEYFIEYFRLPLTRKTEP